MNKYRFYKEQDGRWYIDLPEWTGEKADLEMVLGANDMLDVLARGDDWVDVMISTEEFEESQCLTLIGDGVYENSHIYGPPTVWLCSVTEFVFGNYPPKIYYR
jgi:hypothetical protein